MKNNKSMSYYMVNFFLFLMFHYKKKILRRKIELFVFVVVFYIGWSKSNCYRKKVLQYKVYFIDNWIYICIICTPYNKGIMNLYKCFAIFFLNIN